MTLQQSTIDYLNEIKTNLIFMYMELGELSYYDPAVREMKELEKIIDVIEEVLNANQSNNE